MLRLISRWKLLSADIKGNVRFYHDRRFMRRKPRKPLFLGTAPSKLFRIPQKPQIPEYETQQLLDLARYHRTYMRQLMFYFKEDFGHREAERMSEGSEALYDTEEKHIECMKINEEWNADIAKVREERLKKEAEVRREEILQELIEAEEREKKRLEEIENLVRLQKKKSLVFINEKNIDEGIEAALATESDFNYAVDLSGNVYRGRMTKQRDVPPDQRENLLGANSDSQKWGSDNLKTVSEASA